MVNTFSASSNGEDESCKLISGPFATFIQLCLASVCILILVIKRHQETPQRDWSVWFFDVMKQGIGSAFGHFSNIYLSMIIATSVTSGDECQWYCLTYITDCTLGILLNIIMLKTFSFCLGRYGNGECQSVFRFGHYGRPPQLAIWFPQLFVWLIIVIISKLILLFSVVHLITVIDAFVGLFFAPLRAEPRFELVVVMVFIPAVMNIVQFWITDTFIKDRDNSSSIGSHVALSTVDLDEDLIEESDESGSEKRSRGSGSGSESPQSPRLPSGYTVQAYIRSILIHLGIRRIWRRIFGRTIPSHTASTTVVSPTKKRSDVQHAQNRRSRSISEDSEAGIDMKTFSKGSSVTYD